MGMSHQNVIERVAAGRSLRDEARETSGVTSALLLSYLDREGGRDAVLEVLRRCDLAGREDELRDENSWFSWETKIALFEATAAVLDKPDFLVEMASFALDANVGGGVKVALRTLGSPQFVFRNIVRANARFNRSHVLELLKLEEGRALLRFAEIGSGRRYHRLDCDYTSGLLAIVPELFGLPAAVVSHSQCAADGAEACIFELRWVERPRPAARGAAGGLAVGAAAAASALLLPAALPLVGLAGVAGAVVLVRQRARWRREQWRHLRRQVEDTEEVTRRLFASLQDLVSDLRLEEVVAKVTRNAQAAVDGQEFMLLVREGDGLVCRSSSDLPGEATAAVEAWANGSRRPLETSLLIDDVARVQTLAPLTRMEHPLCSIASAPLTAAGEPFGLLVALGGQQQTFLPRDVSVLESYAAQVAIAVSNARLYQNERSLAARDPLTGLLNHRSFHEAIEVELIRCAREDFYSSVVLIDLDHFKRVNDEDGHAGGDRLLRAAARALSDVCRRDDLAFRVGGDEFALLLPRLAEDEAVKVAERVCAAIGRLDPRLGASAGVACVGPSGGDKDALLESADRRLYAAKHQGTHPIGLRRGEDPGAVAARVAIDLLAGVMQLHHGATGDHSDAVAELALAVAARLGATPEERELIRQTARVHDIGKLAVPVALLDRAGPLSEAEWDLVRRHPADGAHLLRRVGGLESLAAAVSASHERWDGTGYPAGLAGEEIPFAARVVAACDAFEAMTADRPYQQARSPSAAIDELRACAGSQFDGAVVDALVAELLALPRAP
jgi:diguanylate cyclase (GGDEF)-like protein